MPVRLWESTVWKDGIGIVKNPRPCRVWPKMEGFAVHLAIDKLLGMKPIGLQDPRVIVLMKFIHNPVGQSDANRHSMWKAGEEFFPLRLLWPTYIGPQQRT